jgi:phospholipid/cholesterol/gamma-HCH transport system permease protein
MRCSPLSTERPTPTPFKQPLLRATAVTTLGYVGWQAREAVRTLGGMTLLAGAALRWLGQLARGQARLTQFRWRAIMAQMVRVGVDAVPIICLTIFFIGIIIVLQMAHVLDKFGVIRYVGSVLGVSIVRELGPLLAAMVMSGFAGAAIAAEIGTMSVSEEITALRAAALDPVAFLVVPRLLACMLMIPVLTVIADFVGILGGYVTAVGLLHIPGNLYLEKTIEYLVNKDMITGLIKAEAFAMLICLVACYEGFRVTGGAQGVGRATTQSVVLSVVYIIAADCFFTTIFYFFWS